MKGSIFMTSAPAELMKGYVNSQKFGSTAEGSVNIISQIQFASSGRRKSTGNISILRTGLKMPHIQIFFVSPLSTRHMA